MQKADKQSVLERIEWEGFDYTFIHYSAFPDIKDEKFHELRQAYIDSYEKLAAYVGYPEDLEPESIM